MTTATINLDRLKRVTYEIDIEGVTPLIVHRFSETSMQAIVDKNMGKAATRSPKDPVQEFNDSRYLLDEERDGFPAAGFKAAIIDSARNFPQVTMASLRQSISVLGEGPSQLVAIAGDRTMRQDYVRFGQSSTDVRFRAQYWPWSATISVQVLQDQLTEDALIALVDAAGFGGIGEWRPSKSKTGDYGRFQVVGS